MKAKVRTIFLSNYSLLFILIAVNLLIQFFPLTSETGYEFSLVNSILFFWLGGLLYYKKSKQNEKRKGNILIVVLILFIPLVISILNTLLIKNCPVCFGLPHYFAISLPALFFGFVTMKGIKYFFAKWNLLLFFILFLLLILLPVLEIYLYPQIYFYHFVIGYFPGTMYDELITVDKKLILYRLLNIVFVFIVIYFTSKKPVIKKKIHAALLLCGLIILWFAWGKNMFGFVTFNTDVQSTLTQKIESEHFNIFTDNEIKAESKSIEAMHEFYFEKLTKQLKLNYDSKITSYIFRDRDQKKELFGSRNADVAKPWLNQIYLDEESFEYTAKHELVHVLSSKFGVTPFKVAAGFNPALIEGVAVAFENNFGEKSIHYFAKTGIESGFEFPVDELFTGFNFFTKTSSLSYLYAGSFIKYLSDKYGGEKIKLIYSGTKFENVYGKNISELANQYYSYIDSLDYEINEHTAQLYFGTPPLIEKKCPRFAAYLSAQAWGEYNQKNYTAAKGKFEELYLYTNTYNALNGLIQTNIKLENFNEALNLAKDNLKRFENSAYFYRLEIQLADLFALVKYTSDAEKYLQKIIEQSPEHNYFIAATFRLQLLYDNLEDYKGYLLGEDEDRFQILMNLSKKHDSTFLLSRIIDTAERLGKNYNEIKTAAGNFTPDKSFNSCYAAYQFSRYAIFKGDFETAQKFATFAFENNTRNEYNEIFFENLELVNWSMKYDIK